MLRLELSLARSLILTPVDRDTFQFSLMFLRIVRDPSGKVVAIDYSNPAVPTSNSRG